MKRSTLNGLAAFVAVSSISISALAADSWQTYSKSALDLSKPSVMSESGRCTLEKVNGVWVYKPPGCKPDDASHLSAPSSVTPVVTPTTPGLTQPGTVIRGTSPDFSATLSR